MRITFCKIEKQHHQDSTQHTPDHAAPNVAIINREYLIGVTPPPRRVNISTQQSLHTYRARIDSPRFTSAASCMHAVWPRATQTWIAHVRIEKENPSGDSTPSHLQEYYIRRSPSGRTIFALANSFSSTHNARSVYVDSAVSLAAFAGTLAYVKTQNWGLAGTLQTPKLRIWDLQELCKRQNSEFRTCRNSANVKTQNLGLAGTLQTPKLRIWDLQELCKCQNSEFETCRNSASIDFLTIAYYLTLKTSHLCPNQNKPCPLAPRKMKLKG